MRNLLYTLPVLILGVVACNGGSGGGPATNMPAQARVLFQSKATQTAMTNAQNSGTCSPQLQALIAASEDTATATNDPCTFTKTLLGTIDALLVCEGNASNTFLADYPCDPNSYYDPNAYDPNAYDPNAYIP